MPLPNQTDFSLTSNNSKPPSRKILATSLKIFSLVIFILVSATSIAIGWWWYRHEPLISPLGTARRILGFEQILEKPKKIVYGFLPYWNFKYNQELNLEALTHLALFGLSIQADGSIQTREQNYIEPGWRNLTSPETESLITQANLVDTAVTVTVTSFDNDTIESIVNSPEHIQTLIDETLAYIQEYQLDGINIDFEYVGEPLPADRDKFTQMVKTVTDAYKEVNPNYHVSVSVYADSTGNNRIWDIQDLGQIVDQIVIMAYDFYRPASPQAGPVAPLFGAPELWTHDITSLLAQHLEINTPASLLLGVPFYGYEWQTTEATYQSPTYRGTGRLATYRRAQKLLASDPSINRQWHNQALSPWISYQIDGDSYQIYYDDIQSLGFKYDLVNQTQLAGIAIWALGYEGPHPEMWQLIQDKF